MATATNITPSPTSSSRRGRRRRVKATPLPVMLLMILCIVLLTESVCSTMMIPFVGLYVSFMQNWPKEKAGYSSGFLIGLFMLGQVLSSKMFGFVSDKYGRKICIAVGVFLCAVAMFLFGLSTNIWIACLWRFVHGLFAGCSLAAKTMISDVTDRTNQAKGFALISLTWGVGTLFGPAIGGFLYDPVHKPSLAWLHLHEHSFLARYPAFLPSAIAVAYNLFAVCVCVLFLRETNKQAQPLHTMLPSWAARHLRPLFDLVQPQLPGKSSSGSSSKGATTTAQDVTIVSASAHDNTPSRNTSVVTTRAAAAAATTTKPATDGGSGYHDHHDDDDNGVVVVVHEVPSSTPPTKPPSFGFKQAFQRRLTRNVCIMSMLISGADMLYAETFALWGIVSLADGGLDLGSDQVGVLILVNSVPAVVANMYFANVLSLFASQMNYWRLTQTMYALLSAIVPIAPYMGKNAGYWYTMVAGLVRKVWETWTFAILMLTVAQTAPAGKIGVMYGVQQATACMVRCLVPFVGAPLFAWSVQQPRPFPFNHFLLFLLSSIPLLVSVALSFRVHIPANPTAEAQDEAEQQQQQQQQLQQRHDDSNDDVTGVAGQETRRGESTPHHDDDGNESEAAQQQQQQQDVVQQQPIPGLTNRSFGSTSRHSHTQSRHGGNDTAARSLSNSFALLANSFASNPLSAMLHRNIMPVNLDDVPLKDGDDDDDNNNNNDDEEEGGHDDDDAMSADSRDAMSDLDADDELRFRRFVQAAPSSPLSSTAMLPPCATTSEHAMTASAAAATSQQQPQQQQQRGSSYGISGNIGVEDVRRRIDDDGDDELPLVSMTPTHT